MQGLAFRSVVHPEGARDTIEGARELLVEVVADAPEPTPPLRSMTETEATSNK